MDIADAYVRARIDRTTKERATKVLNAMGLTASDAIRLLMVHIAEERRLPTEFEIPNATTRAAMAELESGRGKAFKSLV